MSTDVSSGTTPTIQPSGTTPTTQPSAAPTAPILDAACAVFADLGYAGTTIDAIARAADVPVDTVTAAYPDTAALLLAVLTRRDDDAAGEVQLLHQPGGLQLLRGLKALTRASLAAPTEARLHTRMSAAGTAPNHPAHRWALERYQWTRSLFTAALRRDQDAGLIRGDIDPRAVAVNLIAMMDGLQLQWLLDPAEVDVAESVAAYIDGLLADIQPTGE